MFIILPCECLSLCICWTEQVNAGWHMQFTDLLEESRLTAKPSHTQVSMATPKIVFLLSPQWAGDSKMLKCTNTLSLPGSLILNRVRLFLPAVLIVHCVTYTCNLEIPLVTFLRKKLHIIFTCLCPCPREDTLLKIPSIRGRYCFCFRIFCSQRSP